MIQLLWIHKPNSLCYLNTLDTYASVSLSFVDFCYDMPYAIFMLLLTSLVDLSHLYSLVLTWTFNILNILSILLESTFTFIFFTTIMHIVLAYYHIMYTVPLKVYMCLYVYAYIYICNT